MLNEAYSQDIFRVLRVRDAEDFEEERRHAGILYREVMRQVEVLRGLAEREQRERRERVEYVNMGHIGQGHLSREFRRLRRLEDYERSRRRPGRERVHGGEGFY